MATFTLTSPPTAPSRSMSSTAFAAAADAFVAWFSTHVSEMNSALAIMNVTLWVSGATVAAGAIVVSPANGQYYVRITATGSGTTDPSADTTNYLYVGGDGKTTVASAATPNIWTGTGRLIDYTGTTTATGFSAAPQAGSWRTLYLAAAASFTAGANMLIDGVTSGNTITLSAGDRVLVTAVTTTQFRLQPIYGSGATGKVQPITASVAANALTVTINPTTLDFRSATLGSGAVVTRSIASAISVVVPSGATLGTISGAPCRLAVLAIDNAGTVEAAVVNCVGAGNLDETGLISTTAISAAATSANVIYSTTARTNVAYRLVGYKESTQATAGTWATAPSTIQGEGGNAHAMRSSMVLATTVASTSGTAIDFTNIPQWARRVTINFVGVSTNGANPILVQIGDAGGVETTGYLGGDVVSITTQTARTTGFGTGGGTSVSVHHGSMVLTLADPSTNTWVETFSSFRSDAAISDFGAGSKSLSPGPLDRVRITTSTGVDTFDAGTINVSWE